MQAVSQYFCPLLMHSTQMELFIKHGMEKNGAWQIVCASENIMKNYSYILCQMDII